MGFPQIVTIDDRLLMFGLDRLYRKAMQGYERAVLLAAARKVAEVLRLTPQGAVARA
jgi:hypothetical protein